MECAGNGFGDDLRDGGIDVAFVGGVRGTVLMPTIV